MYWVQVGYAKSQATQYRLQSYFEKNDKNGYITDYFSLRYPDNIYEYWISKHPEYLDWRCGSDDWSVYLGILSPNEARDYQAFSEMTNTAISIHGTHFMYLSYKIRYDWRFWDRHVSRADFPYWILEVSNYEFYAGGGG